MTTVALRTSLIWQDEVMEDLVAHKPMKITVGNTGTPTFVVPNVGLPKDFAIVRPGNRGYLLTLGERMRGTISIDGEEKDVAELVRQTNAGGFSATPISGKDWGVIELDESGDYKIFFQFVPVEAKDAKAGDKGAKAPGDKKDKVKNFDFNALDLNGRMRTPQLLYFLERANEELERASLEKRSFIPHMVRSVEEEQL